MGYKSVVLEGCAKYNDKGNETGDLRVTSGTCKGQCV